MHKDANRTRHPASTPGRSLDHLNPLSFSFECLIKLSGPEKVDNDEVREETESDDSHKDGAIPADDLYHAS
jgi:hypothetical protein